MSHADQKAELRRQDDRCFPCAWGCFGLGQEVCNVTSLALIVIFFISLIFYSDSFHSKQKREDLKMSNLVTLQEISEKRDRKSFNSGVIVGPRSNSAKFSLQESNSQNGSRSTIGDDLQESLQRGREGLDDESKEDMEEANPVIPMTKTKKEEIKPVLPILIEKKEEKKLTVVAEKISILESNALHGEKSFRQYDVKQDLDDESKEEKVNDRRPSASVTIAPVIPLLIEKKEEKKGTLTPEKISLLESKALHGERSFREYDIEHGAPDNVRKEEKVVELQSVKVITITKKEEIVPVPLVTINKKEEIVSVMPVTIQKKEEKKEENKEVKKEEKNEEMKATHVTVTEKVCVIESNALHGERTFCEYDVEQVSTESQVQGSAPIGGKEVRAKYALMFS